VFFFAKIVLFLSFVEGREKSGREKQIKQGLHSLRDVPSI
jgi:hypothetical protein